MENDKWIEHAYLLQRITIQLQGTRHSDREDMLAQLNTVATRIRDGDLQGEEADDDFGYQFQVVETSNGPSLFGDDPAVQR